MEGWNTRRTNEAAERSERDAAMRIIGAQEECARIRRELREIISTYSWNAAGSNELPEDPVISVIDLRTALDRICLEPNK